MERRSVPAELLGALLRALGGGARPPTVSARSSPGRRVRAGEAKGRGHQAGALPGALRGHDALRPATNEKMQFRAQLKGNSKECYLNLPL